ncbi:MAG: hypothetical protein CMF12_13695 [Idiomarina sp.]|nr:hypothetical protein [Idiomarina sp.]
MIKISTNYITFLIWGVIAGFLVRVIGQLTECDSIDISQSVAVCANGEEISSIWRVISYLFMASGAAVWIYKNLPQRTNRK